MGVRDGLGMILIGGCNLDPSHGQFMAGFELPGGAVVKSQCRRLKRYGFDPWVGKIPLE